MVLTFESRAQQTKSKAIRREGVWWRGAKRVTSFSFRGLADRFFARLCSNVSLLAIDRDYSNVSSGSVNWSGKQILTSLRTVPTIVSAHTFCASRKTLFKRALGLTLDAINYATNESKIFLLW